MERICFSRGFVNYTRTCYRSPANSSSLSSSIDGHRPVEVDFGDFEGRENPWGSKEGGKRGMADGSIAKVSNRSKVKSQCASLPLCRATNPIRKDNGRAKTQRSSTWS